MKWAKLSAKSLNSNNADSSASGGIRYGDLHPSSEQLAPFRFSSFHPEKGISSPRADIIQNFWFCMFITAFIALFIAPYTYTGKVSPRYDIISILLRIAQCLPISQSLPWHHFDLFYSDMRQYHLPILHSQLQMKLPPLSSRRLAI